MFKTPEALAAVVADSNKKKKMYVSVHVGVSEWVCKHVEVG